MLHDGYGGLMLAALVPVSLVASWYDFRHHRVPNWLNAAIAITGLSVQATYWGWAGLSIGVQGMLVGFGMLIVLWLMNGMGAGDVKFMAAVGTWLGPQMTFYAVLAGGLLGGVLALGMILYKRNWAATGANLSVLFRKVSRLDTAFSDFGSAKSMAPSAGLMPYAIPLTLGTLLVAASHVCGWWKVL